MRSNELIVIVLTLIERISEASFLDKDEDWRRAIGGFQF